MAIAKHTPYFLTAFLIGVLARSFFDVPENWIFALVGLIGGFLAIRLLTSGIHGAPDVLILIFCFLLGILHFSIFENNIAKDQFHNHYGETLTFAGTVIFSELKPNSSRVILETDLGRVLVVSRIYPQYRYGDVLEVNGEILEPEPYAGFDMKSYLAKEQIYAQMVFPEIKNIGHEPENNMLSILFSFKEKFEANLKAILPEPHALLANGMLLGKEGVMDQALLDAFRKTGTIHILVLSGYNITIVAAFIMAGLGFFLPVAFAWAGAILGILAFTVMTGAEPAAVRASIMAIIGLFALKAGRLKTTVLMLLWAAVLMTFWNPMYLRFDRGFQLSFAATLGLILLAQRFQKILWFLPKFLSIRESASASLSAQLFVLPLLISWGNFISFFSPLVNILVVGVVPAIMFFSFLGGMLVFISHYLGAALAVVSYVLISYQIYIVEFFSRLNV